MINVTSVKLNHHIKMINNNTLQKRKMSVCLSTAIYSFIYANWFTASPSSILRLFHDKEVGKICIIWMFNSDKSSNKVL
jgi:hypothetical protein